MRTSLRPLRDLLAALALLGLLPFAAAQEAPRAAATESAAPAEPLAPAEEVAAVRAILDHLASDSMGGRNTPSPGLEESATWIAKRFESAGLRPVGEAYVHRYTNRGWSVPLEQVRVVLHPAGGEDLALRPGEDVRLLRAGGGAATEHEALFVRSLVDPKRDDEAGEGNSAWIKVLEVAADSPVWHAMRGDREELAGRRGGAPRGTPMILVREGLLPAGKFTASVSIPAASEVELRLPNVVAVRPGTTHADEIVLVSAHMDHVGVNLPRNAGADLIFNGADDDATGTTAVVRLAERLAARKEGLRRTIAFVTFSGEEKGLVGSQAMAKDPPFPLEKIAVNLNLEMLGRPEPDQRGGAWFTGVDLSDFAAIATVALQRRGVRVLDFPMGDRLFFASDNASFARQGVVAHSISAGSLHEDYHQPGDEPSKIDFEHMTRVVLGIEEAIVEFAQREERPAYNEKGRKALQLDR